MNFKIKKGQVFSFSQAGHNGFFYPGEKVSNILHDVEGDRLAWVGSDSKKAVAVLESAALPFGSNKQKTVIWI